jgi:glucose/mannose transport system substrate-binding protein
MARTKMMKLFGMLAATAMLLAACGGGAASPAAEEKPAADGGAKKLEIFSWWTNGGEADGINAMYEIYKQQNPGVEIINATVAGAAGTNAKTVLKTRLEGGDPPDSWQVHAGKELTQYVDADKVMPAGLIEQLKYKGEIWSVPVNIHRSNVLWYNKKIFDENGLTPPTTFEEFKTVAEALKAKGITPLALGGKDKFETPHLFESVLLGTYGVEDYNKLVAGDEAMWQDARLAQSAENLKMMIGYSNEDRASLAWADAAQLVLDGKAGMTIMGDWAHGYYLSKGAKVNVDYGYAPAPGNGGVFMWLSDSFGLAKNAPNPDQAKAWLAVCGSKEGQDAFNPKKGSIPARTDADVSLYDEYLQYSIKAFGSEKVAPSIVHGAAAPEPYMVAYNNALNTFAADTDVEALVVALQDATAELK